MPEHRPHARATTRRFIAGLLVVGALVCALWPDGELRREHVARHGDDEALARDAGPPPDERPARRAAELGEPPQTAAGSGRGHATRDPLAPGTLAPELGEPVEPEPLEPAPEALEYPDEFLEPLPPPDLPVWAYDGAVAGPDPAPTRIARRFDPDAPTRAVQDELRKRDAPIGMDLPGAGRIARLLAVAVRDDTPAVSVATYVARVSSDGEIVSIDVASFSGGNYQQWQAAADVARAQLGGVALPLPGHLASGALVTLRVIQNLELPSGSGRKRRGHRSEEHLLSRGVPKPGRLARTEEPIVSAYDLLPPDLQGLGDPETMLPPINTDGSGSTNYIGADLVDIGAHAERVVKVQLTIVPSEIGAGKRKPGPRSRRARAASDGA